MKNFLLTLAVVASLFACNSDDPDIACIPAFPGWELVLVDGNNDPLIGVQFVQDSFKLSNSNNITYVRPTPFGTGNDVQIVLPDLVSGADYYLELSQSDSDTLNIEYEEFESCGPAYRTLMFTYNGEVIYDGQGNFSTPAIVVKE